MYNIVDDLNNRHQKGEKTMKKRFISAAVTMLLALSIIGSGFSIWYFNNNTITNEDQKVGTNVTQLVEVGSIVAADEFTINFDQTVAGREANGGNLDLNDGCNGITLNFADNAKTKAVYTSSSDGVDTVEGVVGFTFTTTIKVSEDLAKYIDINHNDNSWTKTKNENGTEYTFSWAGATEFDWTQVTFSYAENNEPATKDDYLTFKSIASATKIEVSYNVSLTPVAGN